MTVRDDAFYWEGLAARELRLRVCDGCGRAACPPRPGCPHCGDPRGTVQVASGRGRLYSWTVCHVAFDPRFAGEVPYVVGIVELPEGARILARIEETGFESLRADMALEVRWRDADGPAPLVFVPAAAGATSAAPGSEGIRHV